MKGPVIPVPEISYMRLSFAFACLAATCLSPAEAARPIAFSSEAARSGALVLPLASKADLSAHASLLDGAARSAVERALEAAEFDYSAKSVLALRGIGSWSQLVIIGTGSEALSPKALQHIGGLAAQQTAGTKGPVTVIASGLRGTDVAAQIALGAELGGYTFDRYKYVDPAKPAAGRDAPITIVSQAGRNADAQYAAQGRATAEATRLARDLIREPANVIYPESFVSRVQESLRGVRGVTVTVLDVPAMERLGMGSILSVGKGSVRPPRMMIVEYKGAGAQGAPVVLAGKGITFDSGGISLKPGAGMWEMKGDMAGAAAAVAAVVSLAKSQAPVNVVGIAALAENMPGGGASRPGDVVKAINGKTIEILNTDAEGRLVLADAVAYAEQRYKPAAIVDIATLTGAVVGALGDEYAGLFSRSDALADQLTAAGRTTGEELWRLPLHKNYGKDMESKIADIKNVVEGGGPGAGLGAHFIGYFVERTPWAHLDIAGVDSGNGDDPTVPDGFAGFGVRLLDRFVRDFRPVPPADAQAAR
jgi:leucyl aminopeptidase